MLYVNGNWVEEGEPSIQAEDRGYNFGDGIYEVARIYQGRLYQWEAHLARLFRSAREIRLDLPWNSAQLSEIAAQLMAKNGITSQDDAILYLQVSRGASPRQHDIPQSSEPVLTAFVRRKERPLEQLNNGISAKLVADIRWLRCDIKTLNLLGAVLVKEEAKDAGAADCILHRDGIVTECSASNFFAVKDGQLYTHPANNLILHGITRQTVIDLALKSGIPVQEEAFSIDFVKQADELFLTGTTSEITPITSVDGQPVGNGQVGHVVKKLQALFEENIRMQVSV
ncbi:D-amino-acid transaminase [Brevibacillus fulvus]|uniref:D-alanine aminotransferase n=1 Tax=Brevibacillus fulvus TaxID=1125967 RepID=A0A939BTK7_9BACL|nr:D-amino-acid transaminase [Brevibacillus fulvus]MBM7588556.1 D-alanine transaminase [Brevibacillus fulvus]